MATNNEQENLDLVTILYVEDDENVREGLLRFLKRRYYTVYTAINGQEGLETYHKVKPDMLITDIQMPIMDGLCMCEEIRKVDKDIPIIVTTAFNHGPYVAQAEILNVSKYIKKPILKDELLLALSACAEMVKK